MQTARDFRRDGPLHVGQVIDERYELIELLSRGVIADVGKVRHRVLGRSFALKVLRSEWARDVEFTERLLREARVLGALDHPNVVSITDCGRLASGEPYLVMEYVEGVSLDRLIAEHGALDVELALEIASGVCEALDATHRLGIIHRDLKPDNIYVVQRGGGSLVKVLDFGLARVPGQGRLTRPNTAQGTPEYMSPEQATGAEVDARTDIYSLGVTLYEMLSGRVPFAADSFVALAHQHMYAPVPPLSRWLGEGHPALRLERFVLRCLEKNPHRRFPSAGVLRQALDPFRVPDKTLRLPRPPEIPHVPRSGERRRLVRRGQRPRLRYANLLSWAIVGCCVGTLMLALVYWLGSLGG